MPAHDGIASSLQLDQVLDKLNSNRWIPLAVNLAALALLLYGLTTWTWRLLSPPAPPTLSTSRVPDVNQASNDLQSILSAQPFGQVQVTAEGPVDPSQLPVSSLNVVVTGIMAQQKDSCALVSVNGQPEMPICIGQEVTAGATLEAVYPERIVLRRGSSLEMVLLKDDNTLQPGSIQTGNAAINKSIQSLGGGKYSIDRKALSQNITPEALNQASVTSGAEGLTLREVQPGSMFERIGLRPGDIVRNVNGEPVRSLDDIARVYTQLAATPNAQVNVEVMREGNVEMLQYQMQ